jgi:hypothetical protein
MADCVAMRDFKTAAQRRKADLLRAAGIQVRCRKIDSFRDAYTRIGRHGLMHAYIYIYIYIYKFDDAYTCIDRHRSMMHIYI